VLSLDMTAFLGGDAETTSFETWQRRLAECGGAIDSLNDWIEVGRRTKACREAGLGEFVEWCAKRSPFSQVDEALQAFQRQFYRLWLDESLAAWPEFGQLHGADLERLIDRFRQADRRWLNTSRERLIAMADARRPQKGQSSAKTSRLGQLEAEVRRKRGLKPIRKLFAQLGDVVQALKPCYMMSPMSAAQYLEPGKLAFDLVIFDEASQVEPADALGAIARARQVILVGDEKQLPPTNFFGAINAADAAEEEGDEESLETGDLESVLAMGQVCLRLKTTLRWHYRSQHSSLIEFSNEAFYDRQLRVFPSPRIGREQFGLSFRHVPDGVYFRGKGQYNAVEARAVADAVLDHARQFPDVSLGVGAFSQAQQRAIEDQIEALRRESSEPALEEFFNPGRPAHFFVKNLETIQGDEREVIFLSVGYGPDEHGRTSMNFGPLNREGGWRRLNVLVTRARRRCVLFSSLVAEHLELKPSTPRGVCALKDYLHFAQHGSLPTIRGHGDDHDSPFEADVCQELRSRGWCVHAQVGCAGFAIDLAVVDPQTPGKYLLGIECDGATYHSSATARDRDRLRQMVLENLGWKLHRVWSADWFQRRAETLEGLLRRLERLSQPGGGEESEVEEASPAPQGPAKHPPEAAEDGEPNAPAASAAAPVIPGMLAYRRYAWKSRSMRSQLTKKRTGQLVDILADVVAVEGPIHRDALCRGVAAAHQARYTGHVKTKLVDALAAGAAAGRYILREPFVWPAGMERPPVRWRGGDEAAADADLICIEEVAEAAALVVRQEFGIPLDDLPASTIRALGFKRIGPQLLELGRAGVERAVAARLIVADNSGFMVAANRD
jgi:very-short-patch-repair endonuclease